MSRYSACRDATCGIVVEGRPQACPKCGGPLRDVSESPIRGIVLVICGLLLIGIMTPIVINTMPTMLEPNVSIDGARFTGSAEQRRLFLGLFAVIILFGLTALINGVFHIVTRRQSRAFVALSLGLAAALMAMVYVVKQVSGG